MNGSTQPDNASSFAVPEINKYALKLIGLEGLKDEEILESISNYVQPSSIQGLFYDSFNSFYVLHLSDIESTSHLIGKTLQMGGHQVSFLPLLDCFVIRNVYLSLSNNDVKEIFTVFGNVFEVTNFHVLPNSSRFSHVLSGTREISYFLSADDFEVNIPITVMHLPYTFHVKRLCVGCLTEGHSLLNCPIREDGGFVTLPVIVNSVRGGSSGNENSVVIKQEMSFSVSRDDTLEVECKDDNDARSDVVTTEEKNILSKKTIVPSEKLEIFLDESSLGHQIIVNENPPLSFGDVVEDMNPSRVGNPSPNAVQEQVFETVAGGCTVENIQPLTKGVEQAVNGLQSQGHKNPIPSIGQEGIFETVAAECRVENVKTKSVQQKVKASEEIESQHQLNKLKNTVINKKRSLKNIEISNTNSIGTKEMLLNSKGSDEDDVQEIQTSENPFSLPSSLVDSIKQVKGPLTPMDVMRIVHIDARSKRNVILYVLNVTRNVKEVVAQLRKIIRQYLVNVKIVDSEAYKFKRKLSTLIKVLNGF